MAIYGHMNKKQLPDNDQDPPPGKKDEVPLEETETNETILSFLREAEDAVKSTQQEVTQESNKMNLEETTHSTTTTTTQETDQHFTIANSPTRFQHYKDSNTKE